MRFLGVLGVCGIIAQVVFAFVLENLVFVLVLENPVFVHVKCKHFQQGSLQPEGPESRILVLPPQAAPFLPSACNSGLTFCELDHLPSAASYPTSHVRKLTHKLKRLRGSILLQPVVNNVTDSTITDFLKRYVCHILLQAKG